jgi:outer membrane lipoprotein carrier protein
MNAKMLRYGGLAAALVVIGIVVFNGGDEPVRGGPAVVGAGDPAGLRSEAEPVGMEDPGVAGPDAEVLEPAATVDTTAGVVDDPGTEPVDGGSAVGGSRDAGPPSPRDRATGGGEAGNAGAEEQAPSVEGILRSTSAAYEDLRAFRAGFDQEVRNTLLGRTTRSSGTLYQRRPDRFLMDFSDPEGDLIVSDGTAFWMYYPSVDEKQVMRSSRGGGLDLHAQFIGDPVARFEATYEGRESVRSRPAYVLTLVPREPLGYRRLKVWIDAEDHLVRRFELTETNENVRHFELHDLQVNPTLPDSLFEFTPPADAVVVNAG